MGRRTTLMLVAIVVAALGSTLVFLYVQGINDRAIADQEPVEVLTAKSDIAAGESIDDALAAGKLELTEVPKVNILPGALTTTDGMDGQLALAPIFAGEQIVAAKFGATANTQALTIPKSDLAVSVEFSDPDRVAGFVQPGSKVAIFVCVKRLNQTKKQEEATADATCQGVRLLLSDVEVIGAGTTTLLSTTTTDETGTQTTEEIPKTILTLALNQKDAEKVILAKRNGDLTLGLMNDESEVAPSDGVYVDNIFK